MVRTARFARRVVARPVGGADLGGSLTFAAAPRR
jgi:hypothetical protein